MYIYHRLAIQQMHDKNWSNCAMHVRFLLRFNIVYSLAEMVKHLSTMHNITNVSLHLLHLV